MYNVLPLFKSHYSLGKSILTLEKPKGSIKKYPLSIFDILLEHKMKKLFLVDDSINGLLQANQTAKDNKIELHFGLRLNITESVQDQNEESLSKRAKYVIVAKSNAGYEDLVKIATFAAKTGYYYTAAIDFKNLGSLWTKNLKLVVPFYDSFLYMNSFHSHSHVPRFDFTTPTFFIESNDLPFDPYLAAKVVKYCAEYKYKIVPAQSIYYKSESDFLSYLTFRCIHARSFKKSSLERPDIEHMGSEQFNFDKWLKNNNV